MTHKYTTIDYFEYQNFPKSKRKGYYYCYIKRSDYSEYLFNNAFHNKYSGARVWGENSYYPGRKEYWLNAKRFGSNDLDDNIMYIPSDEYWVRYQKLMVFQ